MKFILFSLIFSFVYSSFAGSKIVDRTFKYNADNLYSELVIDSKDLCRPLFQKDCKPFQVVKFKEYKEYSYINFRSSSDLLLATDCGAKNKATTSYVCHIPVEPVIVDKELHFKFSTPEKVEMKK